MFKLMIDRYLAIDWSPFLRQVAIEQLNSHMTSEKDECFVFLLKIHDTILNYLTGEKLKNWQRNHCVIHILFTVQRS